jgi:hypothetical protein
MQREIKAADHAFLRSLEAKLTEYTQYSVRFKNTGMDVEEADALLQIVKRNPLVIYPLLQLSDPPGPRQDGYQVAGQGVHQGFSEVHVTFLERQLPEGYDQRRIAELWKLPKKQQLMEYFGLPPIRPESYHSPPIETDLDPTSHMP